MKMASKRSSRLRKCGNSFFLLLFFFFFFFLNIKVWAAQVGHMTRLFDPNPTQETIQPTQNPLGWVRTTLSPSYIYIYI